jgi:hypothetical protein
VLPAIFFGHGNPMNAVQDNRYTEGWRRVATQIGALMWTFVTFAYLVPAVVIARRLLSASSSYERSPQSLADARQVEQRANVGVHL